MKDIYRFPDGFLWGVATSAAQIEGAALEDGRGLSIWDVFARIPGKIRRGDTPDVACDHYHRFREDVALMKRLGVNTYRFSFSWSRLFPNGRGEVNPQGLQFYRELVAELRRNDIIPNATLYHWDLPYELQNYGGWLSRESIDWFGDYAEFLFRTFGDDIPLWSTCNEPIATYVGYTGGFAPGLKREAYGFTACHNLLLAHGEAVRRFRRLPMGKAQIGIVVDLWHHHPARPDNADDIRLAEYGNERGYRMFLDPIFRGGYTEALQSYMREHDCLPVGMQPEDMAAIREPLDFFGLNCYNRVVDCADQQIMANFQNGGNFLDNGSTFYPDAVYDALHILKDRYHLTIPVYITENGIGNNADDRNEAIAADGRIHDTDRITYVRGILQGLHRAMAEGIDVRGYYLWSLMDNFEWTAGYDLRFGLVHVDPDDLIRRPKDSFEWYQRVIADNAVPLEG